MSRRPKETCHGGISHPARIDLGDWESVRSLSRRAAVGAVTATILLALLLCAGPAAMASDLSPAKDVAFSGRVIERETGKPVKGAEIILDRSIRGSGARTPPAWAGESLIRTDAEGKFRVEFPAGQVAERRLCIAMRIRHPGFIRRKSRRVALADLIRGQASGDEPFFANLTLERGVEYTGQVVVPGGKPAAGIPYVFENGTNRTSYPIPLVMDDYEGQTDDGGRIRLRMPKTQALALFVGPPRTAGRDSPLHPISTSGVKRPPPGTRMSGPPPIWAGSCCRADPALGPAGRHGRPAHRRPDNHRISREGPRSALVHDRGRRQLRPWPAPARELLDLRRRAAPEH